MNPILRNILAVIVSIVIAMICNMGLILLGIEIIAPPEGMNPMDPDSIAAHADKFELKHFLFPFLAHAFGTFMGAYAVTRFAANNHMKLAIGIGVFFLLAGISNFFQIPSPIWFILVDLVLAYIPMAWLAATFAIREEKN